MMALPTDFLPFDPNRDYNDHSSSTESDDELSDDQLHDSMSNGDNNYERKQYRHGGGGVLLVNEF